MPRFPLVSKLRMVAERLDQPPTQADVEWAETKLRAARAQLVAAEAQVEKANAQMHQTEAALEQARVDLERTIIRSPVTGTVISRSVDVGQTVAASLSSPTLFTIAQDLTRMQVDTNVSDTDGQRVSGVPSSSTSRLPPVRL
jgi:HlyD family secretion protein